MKKHPATKVFLKSSGFGLVELMISLLLSSLIILGLTHHYLSVKRQYLDLNQHLEAAFDLNLVVDLLRDAVRKAGFTPCLSLDHLKGIDYQRNQGLPVAIESLQSPDIGFKTHRMSDAFESIQAPLAAQTLLVHTLTFHAKDTLMIANCHRAEIHQIIQVHHQKEGQTLMLDHPLSFQDNQPLFLGEWLEESFLIQKNQKGMPSLFYDFHHVDELSADIKKLGFQQMNLKPHPLIHLTLELNNGQLLEFETMRRQ